MNPQLKDQVRKRANNACEYCGLPAQAITPSEFHIEHIIALQHGGTDEFSNLALACNRCNAYKGPNLTAIDPETGKLVPIFNPREQKWDAHFEPIGALIVGLTPTGRATTRLLNMNAPGRMELRSLLAGREKRI